MFKFASDGRDGRQAAVVTQLGADKSSLVQSPTCDASLLYYSNRVKRSCVQILLFFSSSISVLHRGGEGLAAWSETGLTCTDMAKKVVKLNITI